MKFYFTSVLFLFSNFCFSQDYTYQDSISGHQTCVAFNSINDGHPGPPQMPFFQATLGHVVREGASLNLCVSNTFASEGFFRNSLFSMNVGNLVYQDKELDVIKTIGGMWQHTWFYDNGSLPTISSLVSIQHPFDELDASTACQTTLIINKNIGARGVSYFNAFLDLPTNSNPSLSVLAGYKFFVSEQQNLFLDIIYGPDKNLTLEAALEINLPHGSVISPGINYQRDLDHKSSIFGFGLAILYQTR